MTMRELQSHARHFDCELVTQHHLRGIQRDMDRLGDDLREAQRRAAHLQKLVDRRPWWRRLW